MYQCIIRLFSAGIPDLAGLKNGESRVQFRRCLGILSGMTRSACSEEETEILSGPVPLGSRETLIRVSLVLRSAPANLPISIDCFSVNTILETPVRESIYILQFLKTGGRYATSGTDRI